MKISDVRRDIPFLDEVIYLDAASTTPTPKPVVDAICDYYHHYNSNTGRGAYKTAVKATSEVEKTRSKLAEFINSRTEEIIFTKNTTEAINLVAHGLNFKKGDSLIVPNIEHHSNLVPWLNLKKKGVEIKIIKSDPQGVVDPASIEDAIDQNSKLISITHISNSIGSMQPVEEIGKIAQENDILYLIDAAQSLGHISININKLNADFVAFPGHKGLLGPVGTGFLYGQPEALNELDPLNLGGGTVSDVTEHDFKLTEGPARFEGGTLNISGLIGLGAAVDYIKRIGLDKIEKHGKKLTKMMFVGISEIENSVVYGNPEDIYDMVGFNINGVNCHDVAKILDEQNTICVRSGMHCAIPAMRQIGAYEFGGTVRASIHYYNLKEEIKTLIDTLEEISKFLGS
ncbi:MAG: cysteine desulfurase [Methanobacterium sp.]|nr:cysteine desulfurase [Methanobacterium sp.]